MKTYKCVKCGEELLPPKSVPLDHPVYTNDSRLASVYCPDCAGRLEKILEKIYWSLSDEERKKINQQCASEEGIANS